MLRNDGKLYDLIRAVELPFHAVYDPIHKRYSPIKRVLPACCSMYWPNGAVCILAEMYLLDIAGSLTVRRSDGGSLKTIVAGLSHLIRYCWKSSKLFWELNGDDFYGFVAYLMSEHKRNNPNAPKRNNNTINRIIDICVNFLIWIQSNITIDRVIVGTRDQNPQIRLIEKELTSYKGGKTKKLAYSFKLPKDIIDPKKPISNAMRNQLWNAITTRADPSLQDRRYRARFKSEAEFNNELIYLKERREVLLILMEATGCRPSELADMSASENANCVLSKKLILPTKKRRTNKDPLRKIPIERGCAIKVELFINKHRKNCLMRLKERGVASNPQDKLFVCSQKGTPIDERSLTKEFDRIVAVAGIDARACLSMFRHRFITNMVKLHLKSFLVGNPGTNRVLMTDQDYRTILKRIATFTGHGSEESLMHYIDLAWEELGVFDYVQPALDLINIVESSIATFTSLMADIKLQRHLPSDQIIDMVIDQLNSIRVRTHQSLLSYNSYKLCIDSQEKYSRPPALVANKYNDS